MLPVILMRCDASSKIGLGHLKRSLSLAYAIKETKKAKVIFCCQENNSTKRILTPTGFKGIFLGDKIGHPADIRSTIGIARQHNCRMIILDSYDVGDDYFQAIQDGGLTAVFFDDLLNLDCKADIVINGLIGAENEAYSARHKLLGTSYLVLGPEYSNNLKPVNSIKKKLSIVVTTGGIDHYDLSSTTISLMNKLESAVRLDVIVGEYFDNSDQIRKCADDSGQDIHLHFQPEGISGIIGRCDIGISAGGITVYELAAMGVATIGISLWENQRRNVEELGKRGALLPLSYKPGVHFHEELFKAIKTLIDDCNYRSELSRNGNSIVDGRGGVRVANFLTDMI